MKHVTLLTLLALVASILVPVYLAAATVRVRVTWDAHDPASPTPAGYLLYKREGTGWNMVRQHDSLVRDIDISDLGGGEYRMTAYNSGGESDPSDVFVVPGRPGSPLGARILIEIQ